MNGSKQIEHREKLCKPKLIKIVSEDTIKARAIVQQVILALLRENLSSNIWHHIWFTKHH